MNLDEANKLLKLFADGLPPSGTAIELHEFASTLIHSLLRAITAICPDTDVPTLTKQLGKYLLNSEDLSKLDKRASLMARFNEAFGPKPKNLKVETMGKIDKDIEVMYDAKDDKNRKA